MEPAAMAALALLCVGKAEAAVAILRWLRERQAPDGLLRVDGSMAVPAWTTALAVLAWRAADSFGTPPDEPETCRQAADRAVTALLRDRGQTWRAADRGGHDPSLAGWPWVTGTHSWSEPTAYCILALKASGLRQHPRVREGVRMLLDRILPEGGNNYGNTVVLGQTLRPHVGPTGVVLTALCGEEDAEGRIEKSLGYLDRTIGPELGTISLCQALLALTAHGRPQPRALAWLETKATRLSGHRWCPWKASLLVLAMCGTTQSLSELLGRSRQ